MWLITFKNTGELIGWALTKEKAEIIFKALKDEFDVDIRYKKVYSEKNMK